MRNGGCKSGERERERERISLINKSDEEEGFLGELLNLDIL